MAPTLPLAVAAADRTLGRMSTNRGRARNFLDGNPHLHGPCRLAPCSHAAGPRQACSHLHLLRRTEISGSESPRPFHSCNQVDISSCPVTVAVQWGRELVACASLPCSGEKPRGFEAFPRAFYIILFTPRDGDGDGDAEQIHSGSGPEARAHQRGNKTYRLTNLSHVPGRRVSPPASARASDIKQPSPSSFGTSASDTRAAAAGARTPTRGEAQVSCPSAAARSHSRSRTASRLSRSRIHSSPCGRRNGRWGRHGEGRPRAAAARGNGPQLSAFTFRRRASF
jgi:hypothetical protein